MFDSLGSRYTLQTAWLEGEGQSDTVVWILVKGQKSGWFSFGAFGLGFRVLV